MLDVLEAGAEGEAMGTREATARAKNEMGFKPRDPLRARRKRNIQSWGNKGEPR